MKKSAFGNKSAFDALIASARLGMMSAFNNTKNLPLDEKNLGREKVQKELIKTITTTKPTTTKTTVSAKTRGKSSGSWFKSIVDKTAMSPLTKELMEDNSVKGQDTGVHSSSDTGNAVTGEYEPKGSSLIVEVNPQSWEPETGHSGIENSFAVAKHIYNPNTGELEIEFRDKDGRASGRTKTEQASEDDFLNYAYSPSKGRWAIGKDRNQNIIAGQELFNKLKGDGDKI